MTMLKTLGALALVLAAGGVAEAADTFLSGDVFASTAGGRYEQWRKVTGTWTLIDTLTNSSGSGFTTGSAFDSAGNFYGTDFSNGTVSQFLGASTPHTRTTWTSGLSAPESIAFSSSGTMYVGQAGGAIVRLSGTGTVAQTYGISGHSDWIDLAADQTTMYYTHEGSTILRHNLTTDTGMSDFASGLTHAFALRILGDGGVLVADQNDVKRFDSSGTQVATYDVSGENSWFSLNLDPDGTSFWSGSYGSGSLYKFDIATGTLLDSFSTGHGSGALYGVSVFGERTAATVTAVPLPPAGWMGLGMLGALAGLGVIRRRRMTAV